jgi:hypothetical protein
MEAWDINSKEGLSILYKHSNSNNPYFKTKCSYNKMLKVLKKFPNIKYVVTNEPYILSEYYVHVFNLHQLEWANINTEDISLVSITCDCHGIRILYAHTRDINNKAFRKSRIKTLLSE